MTARDPAADWLEGPEGEKWSRDRHRAAHAGDSYLPNHIASVRPTPGRDPDWDPLTWRSMQRERFGPRDPEQDPSGRPPMSRTRSGRTGR